MERIAEFGTVSFDIFKEIAQEEFGITDEAALTAYQNLKLPKRATSGSAGYDFYAPFDITLKPGETAKIPTGIRAKMENGWVLMIFPRSGFGFKYRLMLDNTVGVIDSDYYYSDNEGHIMVKVTNCSGLGKTIDSKMQSESESLENSAEWKYVKDSEYNERIECNCAGDITEGKILKIQAGQGFAQGIFMPFGITMDDDTDTVRNGGLGSTG